MKYIKYPFYSNIRKRENKLRFKNLDKRARMNARRNKLIAYLFVIFYFVQVILLILLIKFLTDIIENKFYETLMMIVMVLITIVVPIFVTGLLGGLTAKHLPPSSVGELTLKNIQDITTPIRTYYKLFGSSLTTKCYRCSNESFNNMDVIVFLHKKNIRIILDVFHTTKDFGCYELKYGEIETSYIEEDGIIKTLLKADKLEFVLGKRAKPFIKKCFTSSRCPCCGYYTFLEVDRGMYDICPVCFWEDDSEQEKNPNYAGGANRVSLIEARKNYIKYGACTKDMVIHCRPPKEEERSKL